MARLLCILAYDQKDTALAFASSGDNKADGIPWMMTASGTPMLEDYLVALECQRTEEFHGGDHTIIIGEIIRIQMSNCGRAPMTYYCSELNTLIPKGKNYK